MPHFGRSIVWCFFLIVLIFLEFFWNFFEFFF